MHPVVQRYSGSESLGGVFTCDCVGQQDSKIHHWEEIILKDSLFCGSGDGEEGEKFTSFG